MMVSWINGIVKLLDPNRMLCPKENWFFKYDDLCARNKDDFLLLFLDSILVLANDKNKNNYSAFWICRPEANSSPIFVDIYIQFNSSILLMLLKSDSIIQKLLSIILIVIVTQVRAQSGILSPLDYYFITFVILILIPVFILSFFSLLFNIICDIMCVCYGMYTYMFVF